MGAKIIMTNDLDDTMRKIKDGMKNSFKVIKKHIARLDGENCVTFAGAWREAGSDGSSIGVRTALSGDPEDQCLLIAQMLHIISKSNEVSSDKVLTYVTNLVKYIEEDKNITPQVEYKAEFGNGEKEDGDREVRDQDAQVQG